MNDRKLKMNNLKNNIDLQILSIYKNFIHIVYKYVISTYVGDEYMNDEINNHHFNFCWESASKDFEITGITFNNLVRAKEYFKKLVFRLFYSSKLKNFNNGDSCNRMFYETINVLFEFKPTYSDQTEILNNIYKLFNTYE